MQRINTPDGNFHAGDPSAGIKGSVVTAVFMQALQDELVAVTESIGAKLDPTDNKQVIKAIQKLITDAVSTKADAGHVDQSFAEFKKQTLDAMAKLLSIDAAAQTYLASATAAKTYLSLEAAKQLLPIADAAKTYISMVEAQQRFAKGIQVFTEDGEFVVPPGIYLAFVTLVGGGGGGGGGGQDTRNVFVPGGGGGAGEFKYRVAIPVTPGQRIKVTVGKAGQGGKTILAPQNKPLPDGHAGGISSFGSFVSVSGGGAGNGGFTGSGSVGGAGGVGFPGGDSGEYTATPNNSYVRGGGGGSSPLGGGGPSVHGYQSRAGAGYGAGGGGGALYYLKGEDSDGGPGSQGLVIVEW